jgi:hypothetical protein
MDRWEGVRRWSLPRLNTHDYTRYISTTRLTTALDQRWVSRHEVSDRGVRLSNVLLQREWWVEADFDREPLAALSKVQWVRQVDAQRIAVLIATPIADWRRVPVNPKNMEGDKNRYETVIELLDVPSGRLLGSARIAGFPLSLLSGSRAAVYREAEDGTPRVEIHRFALGK